MAGKIVTKRDMNRWLKSYLKGDCGEIMVESLLNLDGYKTTPASKKQNIYGHYDIIVSKENFGRKKVDIKSDKKLSNRSITKDLVVIEHMGSATRYGERVAVKGWLHAHSDYIAFIKEFDRKVYFIEREPLKLWLLRKYPPPDSYLDACTSCLRPGEWCTRIFDGEYKKDLFIFVSINEIMRGYIGDTILFDVEDSMMDEYIYDLKRIDRLDLKTLISECYDLRIRVDKIRLYAEQNPESALIEHRIRRELGLVNDEVFV